MASQNKERQILAMQIQARKGKANSVKARHIKARQIIARKGKAISSKPRQFQARQLFEERQCKAIIPGKVEQGNAR